MRDFFEYVVALVLILVACAALGFAVLLAAVDPFARYQCSNFQAITGKATKYATLDSCYILTAEGWQRWDEYKARAVASEGLKHAP